MKGKSGLRCRQKCILIESEISEAKVSGEMAIIGIKNAQKPLKPVENYLA